MNLDTLLQNLPNLTPHDRTLIERAYHKAEVAHEGVYRKSGTPYFTHCVEVAQILADMKLDAEAIAAALMHDIVEDTDITVDELRSEFGDTVASLVAGVTKLTNLPLKVDSNENGRRNQRETDRELEYFRKMLLMMGDDVRVVLIKLADRLHNMRTLGYMSPEKQIIKARETMEIFAPLANRLGIWQIKWELEDLAFRYLQPDAYRMIASSLDERRADREEYLNAVTSALRDELALYGITDATLTGRPKHITSIYNKMRRKGVPFGQVYDVRAVRVIVHTIPQCYLVLGVVHNLWRPIPGEFDDYIANPKDNFYQSLHTAVLDSQGKTVEVQIRTWEMHENAEYGVAAHWRYKEGKHADRAFDERISYLRRLMEFGPDVENDARIFMDTMQQEVFEDRVYAFTPKGDIVDLPVGATPIDFAYHIHTDVGHRCRGAKVHGRLVSLNYQLKTGDQVEVQTAKRGGPSLDWLNPELGYVKTNRARSKIRHWFRKQNREKHIAAGRTVMDAEIKRLGLVDTMTYDTVAGLFNYERAEDFYAAVGAGDINGAQISGRILEHERQQQQREEHLHLLEDSRPTMRIMPNTNGVGGVHVQGAGGFLVNMGRCCNPVPGDEIVGYITRGRGITVHRTDCTNIAGHTEPERLIDVGWAHVDDKQCYSVPVEIVAYDREGLMRDISTAIADEKINMSTVNVSTKQNIANIHVTMELNDIQQLSRILSRISHISSVVEARRRNMN